jgi:hypothetical protein
MLMEDIIINEKKGVEISKKIIEKEPILIHNSREDFDYLIEKNKFYENKQSKFIDKPKNNFKLR